jgi:hypothetical protein
MVAKLQYGGSFASTETNTVSIRIIDEINFPAYLVAKVVNKNGALDARYTAFDEVRVFEDDITGDPVIFRGKVEKILKAVENGVEILTITARDNLVELHIPFDDATYSQNGADETINSIVRGHIKTVTNIDTPAVGSNSSDFESSLNNNAITVIGKNNGRSVLKTIQDLAAEDPWGSAWGSTTNTGWHFYLDEATDLHYHRNGAYPSAPIGDGLRLKFGLATGSVSDFYKQVLPTPSYSDFVDDVVSEVYAHYQIDGVTSVVRLKLITFTNYNTGSGTFSVGNNITGTAEGGSGTATAQIRLVLNGAMLISHATDHTAEAPNFNPGATITSGATATYTTTSGQETTQAKPVNVRRSTLVFTGASNSSGTWFPAQLASTLSYVSQIAYPVARAGFIDISADTHRKATIKIFDFPIFRRGGTTTVVRAGNQIYLEDSITPATPVSENFTVSKIEYVQEGGKSISSLSLTTNEGSPIRTSGVEKARDIAKDSRVEAVDALVSTVNVYTALDGDYNAPGITFDGSAGKDTGLYYYESGGIEYVAITANGSNAAYFGENGYNVTINENLWVYGHQYPGATNTYDLGWNDGGGGTDYDYRNIYSVNALSVSSDRRLKEDIQPTNLGLSFLNDLTPVSYKWKNKHDDVMDQRHYGLIAQDVVEVLKDHGIDSLEDFGGILHNGNPEQMYKAKYEHFIPILIKAVQELSDEVKELKEKN